MNSIKEQEISENNFEKWMNTNHLSYSSIASICGVSEDIVRRWMSQKEIPKRFLSCLNRLVQSRKSSVKFIDGGQEHGLDFEMSMYDYFKLSRKALEDGCSIGELIARELDSLSKEP